MYAHPTHPSVVIRAARGSDTAELVRLAELDSAPALLGPALLGPALVAEVDGHIVAALGTDSGARLADPFEHSSALVDLLELRARSGRPGRRHAGRRRLRPALPPFDRAA